MISLKIKFVCRFPAYSQACPFEFDRSIYLFIYGGGVQRGFLTLPK